MGLLTWLVVGAIAGWLAGKAIGETRFGLVGDIVTGVIGALVGGWLAATLFKLEGAISEPNLTTIVVAFLVAVVVLFVVRLPRR